MRYRFVCKKWVHKLFFFLPSKLLPIRFPSKSCVRDRTDPSTSNLKRHVDVCDPSDSGQLEDGKITAYGNGSTYSEHLLRFLLSMWCAQSHRPFNIVNDEYLQAIFKMFNSKVKIPSSYSISRNIQDFYSITKANFVRVLQVIPLLIFRVFANAKISKRSTKANSISGSMVGHHPTFSRSSASQFTGVSKDESYRLSSTSSSSYCFLSSLAISWQNARLDKSHTGTYLAEKLLQCLKEFGIEKKVSAYEFRHLILTLFFRFLP